jgi:signal transduction histidine kinase
MLGGTLLAPLEKAWYSIAFSMGMPPAQHMLVIGADVGGMLVPILASAVMLAIAEVLSGASRIADRSRELEVASAAKTRFLAAASHDLRQPVVSISLLTELLREQPLPAAAGPILARIGDSVQALNELLKGLLDLSRFEAGAVQVHKSRIALRLLLTKTTGDEAEAARRKGIALRVHTAPFEILSDAVLLEQILRNLVGNAVRYTRRGGVLVSARRRGSNRVLLQVWDTGPGIPAQSQANVFEEFVQLDPEGQGRSGGLGLGLSLVRRAASVLGTPVALRSVVGRGSCFSIELPLDGFESALGAAVSVSEAGLRGRLVWVVEDDDGVREALRLRLVGWGATVRDFGSVAGLRQALADATRVLPDLLVSDQRLPDGTGIEVAQLLRTAVAALPVLMVTGDTAPADIAMLQASGLPVLHKPFTSEGLLAAMHALGIGDLPLT